MVYCYVRIVIAIRVFLSGVLCCGLVTQFILVSFLSRSLVTIFI